MVRTFIILSILCGAVVWTPLWVQIILLAVAIIVVRHRVFLILPAILADALYAPTRAFDLGIFQTTLAVAGILFIHWVVTSQTRFGELYAKKV